DSPGSAAGRSRHEYHADDPGPVPQQPRRALIRPKAGGRMRCADPQRGYLARRRILMLDGSVSGCSPDRRRVRTHRVFTTRERSGALFSPGGAERRMPGRRCDAGHRNGGCAGLLFLREVLPEGGAMTTTTPPPAEGAVSGGPNTGYCGDGPPGCGARPLPHVTGVTHRLVTVPGARLHVAEAGTGEPVMLLHGFPQHWYAWAHVIPLLSGDYRLICPDWRGFGWSQAPPRGYDTASRAADVLALMDALGLRRVRLIAHDWGSHAAFTAALQAPERVSHLLALNAAHLWLAQRRLLPQLWRFWYTAFLESPGIGRLVRRHWPGLTRFLLRRGAGGPAVWQPGEVEEFVAASRQPGSARAG